MSQRAEEKVMVHDPLADVLEGFYKPRQRVQRARRAPEKSPDRSPDKSIEKPTHYKIVCISLYTEDIERLEKMVAELKRRGHTKANKSQLIRAALDQVDLDRVPKGY